MFIYIYIYIVSTSNIYQSVVIVHCYIFYFQYYLCYIRMCRVESHTHRHNNTIKTSPEETSQTEITSATIHIESLYSDMDIIAA